MSVGAATAYVSHPACRLHGMTPGHPEMAARLTAIETELRAQGLWDQLRHEEAPEASCEQILRAHDAGHLDRLVRRSPPEGLAILDPDTAMNPHSLAAALRAAGAVVRAVDLVLSGAVRTAFCAVRPPGHHAERSRAMGFCLLNNVAIGAAHALASGLRRVAVVDFDVHHGNGTEEIFRERDDVLLCSTFQHPLYPCSGAGSTARATFNLPLPEGTAGPEFRAAFSARVVPALDAFRPELILVSAGFDAHRDDPLAGLALVEDDYAWVTSEIVAAARRHAKGRVVSTLEGGYDLEALARSTAAHVRGLLVNAP